MNGQKVTQVTEKMFEDYLEFLAQKGKTEKTLVSYRGALRMWYKSLPQGAALPDDAENCWETALRESGLAEATVRSRTSVLSGFLAYIHDPEAARVKNEKKGTSEPSPETVLSREDYRMLLRTAKVMGRRRAYLLIKTIVCVGIRTQEFHELTLESVRRGQAVVTSYGIRRAVPVPEPIRSELMEYAEQQGIETGPIFVTKDGTPMVHSAIWKEVKKVCRYLGISEEKGYPRSLHQLHKDTGKQLYQGSIQEAADRYRSLLLEEETLVGWDVGTAF